MGNSEFASEFINETKDMLADASRAISQLDQGNDRQKNFRILFRNIRSLHGGASMFKLTALKEYCAQILELLTELKAAPEKIQGNIGQYFLELLEQIPSIIATNQAPDKSILNVQELLALPPGQDCSASIKVFPTPKTKSVKGLIYVVDDEEMILSLTREILTEHGFNVKTFISPLEVIKTTKITLPDLILTDYKMPEMNGLEMMQEIFKVDPNISFVFLSAFLTKKTMQEAIKLGISHFLEKPLNEKILLNTVNSAIGRKKSLDLAFKSINHLLYHFEELNQYFEQNNKQLLAQQLKDNIANLLAQKKLIKDLIKNSL